MGAEVLRDHLREMSGATLDIVSEASLGDIVLEKNKLLKRRTAAGANTFILVGEGDLLRKLGLSSAPLGPGGIAIRTFPNALALFGPDTRTPSDPWGTLYAVFRFLEEPLGFRNLWPGQLGKLIPRRPTVRVSRLQVSYTPPLRQRQIRDAMYNSKVQAALDELPLTRDHYQERMRQAMQTVSYEAARPGVDEAGWFRWHRLGGTLDLRSAHAFGHMWEKYGKEHPEWFALQPNGSRDQKLAPDRPRLCKSNIELIEAIAREKIEELSAHPSQRSVAIGPNDGSRASFCMCEKCKALDPPEGRKTRLWDCTSGECRYFDYVSLTDRMVYFWNAIAERVTAVHPSALLVADAYSAYTAPPIRRKLHPNIVIRFAALHYLSDGAREQALEDWDAWSRTASKIYFRPNLLLAGWREGVPLVYVHKLGADFQYLAHHEMLGTDFDSCVHHWATQGLNYYVLAKLQWNPELDVDEIIDDYCSSGFGPAAGLTKQYFLRVEELTDEIAAKHRDVLRSKEIDVTTPYTPEVLSELNSLLDEAERRARGNEDVVRRIAFLRRGLAWTDVQTKALPILRRGVGGDGENRRIAAEVLSQRRQMGLDMFREEPLSVNVGHIFPWGL